MNKYRGFGLFNTDELLDIQRYAGIALAMDDIAVIMGCTVSDLEAYGKSSLALGRAQARAGVMATAYKLAAGGEYPSFTQFWLQNAGGWMADRSQAETPVGLTIELTGGKADNEASQTPIASLTRIRQKKNNQL